MTVYDVTVWREPGGEWSAEARGLDGAFTAGRSLAEVERNIRESIAITLDLPRSAESTVTVHLDVSLSSPNSNELISQARQARQAAKTSHARATELTAETADALRGEGLSVRDIATVLGISFQRAQQLTSKSAA